MLMFVESRKFHDNVTRRVRDMNEPISWPVVLKHFQPNSMYGFCLLITFLTTLTVGGIKLTEILQ
jgi:hypothetical protein